MRIALVTPYDFSCFGGVSEHVAALQRELLRRGHEAVVVAPRPRWAGSEAMAPFVGCGRTVPIRTNGSRARITLDPTCYPELKALMRRERFDVVHLHELLTPVLPALALLASRAVNVGTFHSFREARPRHFAPVGPLLAYLLRRLDGRIAVSEPARQYIDRYAAGACDLIPNGVDLDRFGGRADPLPWALGHRPTILFVGRFDEPRKGLAPLLRALPRVRTAFPEARLVVVGAGNQKRFRRLLGCMPASAVQFAGAVGRNDLPRYYASCDVFCAPSLGGESFGIVLLEAMASGKPIVASNIPGYAGLLTDGREGRLTEPGCPEALATALVELLADPAERDRQGRHGRATAAGYAWPEIAGRVLAAYERSMRN